MNKNSNEEQFFTERNNKELKNEERSRKTLKGKEKIRAIQIILDTLRGWG